MNDQRSTEVKLWHEEVQGMKEGPALFEGQQQYVRYEDYSTLCTRTLELEARAEAAQHQAALYRAVLDGSEYRNLGSLKTVEQATDLGKHVATMTKSGFKRIQALTEERESFLRNRDMLHEGLARAQLEARQWKARVLHLNRLGDAQLGSLITAEKKLNQAIEMLTELADACEADPPDIKRGDEALTKARAYLASLKEPSRHGST